MNLAEYCILLQMIKYYNQDAHALYTGEKTRGLTEQPLYWGGGDGVRFNLARLSELPHVTVNASEKMRKAFYFSLCHLGYVAARCAAGSITELGADYDAATQKYPENDSLRVFSQFFRENAHILDRDPAVIVQQVLNTSAPLTTLLKDDDRKPGALTPWLDEASAPTPCHLVNKSSGENPVLMTLPAEGAEPGEQRFFRYITTVTIGNRTFIITYCSITSFDTAREGEFFTVWDAKSGAKLLHTRAPDITQIYCAGVVGGGTGAGAGNAFHILYIDRTTLDLRCLTVSVRETLMALEGRRIPMALNPEAVNPEARRHGTYVMAFWCASHDQRHLVTLNIDEKKSESHFDRKPKEPEIPQGVLKLWDLTACLNASKTQVVEPLKSISGDAIITRGMGDTEAPFTALKSPPVLYSPCDRFLMMSLETEEPRTGYKRPHLTLLDAQSLTPVWTWHNKDGPFLYINPEVTCFVPGHQGAFLIAFDGGFDIGIMCLIITENKDKGGGQLEGHLGWCSGKVHGFRSITSVVAQGAIRILARPQEGPLVMWRIGRSALKKVPPKAPALSACKNASQIPKMKMFGDLPMIGRSFDALCAGGVSDNSLLYSISDDGEIKVTDVALYEVYKPTDALRESVSVVRLTPDASKVLACAGPILAAFDAETGRQESALTKTDKYGLDPEWGIKSIVPLGREEILVKTEQGVEGRTGRLPLSAFNEPHATYNMTRDEGETDTFTLQRLADAAAEGPKRDDGLKGFAPGAEENKFWSSDLSVSYDGRWVCKPPAGGSRSGEVTEERPVYIPEGSSWGVTKQGSASEKGKPQKEKAVPAEKDAGNSKSLGGYKAPRGRRSLRGGGMRGGGRRGDVDDDDDDDDAARYTTQLLVTLMDRNTGTSRDVVIHRMRSGLFLRLDPTEISQYRGAFSHDAKLFLAWGNMTAQSDGGQSHRAAFAKHFPPMFKLYEMGEGGTLKQIAHLEDPYKSVGWIPSMSRKHVSSVHFLPGDTHLVTTSRDGTIRIRGPLPALAVTTELVTVADGVLDSDIVVTPSNATLLVTCHFDRSVRVWRIDANRQEQSVRPVARYYNASDVHSVCACVKKGKLFVYFGDKLGGVKILNVDL